MRTDLALAGQLAAASVRARTGSGTLGVIAVAAFTVVGWLTMTVAGGTWMFVHRWTDKPSYLSPIMLDPQFSDMQLGMYVWLALWGCALLIPAIFSLTSATAVLGASGREERLAVLRLVGASRARVIGIALAETLAQAGVGVALGTALSVITAPAWAGLSFQDTPVRPHEFLLPWWGYLAVPLVLLLIVAAATVRGLARVSITPLGVARRTPPKAMRAWRVVVLVLMLVAAVVLVPMTGQMSNYKGVGVAALILLLVVQAINLAVPYLLQFCARLAAHLPGTAWATAMRRVSTDPRPAWRRVSVLSVVGIVVGFLGSVPFEQLRHDSRAEDIPLLNDLVTGGLLVVIGTFLVAGVATFLTQASGVFESQRLNESLHRIGAPRAFMDWVSLWETLGPLLLSVLAGTGVGLLFGRAIYAEYSASGGVSTSGVPMMCAQIGLGCAIVLAGVGGAALLRRSTVAHRRGRVMRP
ncbi:FtsX-like permease family protein [Corynebacterium uberis]|uniref:FtsX-like permease family protein n=1 Tax=Corynebacterium TaxID=1716 RepID=UPI001D0ACBDD|nr:MULTISPECIES: FtsX-like permease family protein [Corynebacterium]MCZ9309094.1 ABC transporter permease [Corynebacterium sp. c6VSa_13]UDL74440.1 ABC transporter permease [Corynebacterium uberis]UDL78938.1 ABC transporter permease [Corynebacterium uberis]UDL83354.1 ABC transporter permease [Corynebacterium uberis]UDL85562.1 ABC transporter permease [Corynebacterium uberis]